MRAKREIIDNDAWVTDHFEMIVDKYGGKYPYLLVAGGRCFPIRSGQNIRKIEENIRRKYGPTLGMPIPRRKDFIHILVRSVR